MVEARIKTTKALMLTFAGAISLILLVLGLYNLVEFTDSVAFCGVLCHDVMYPEYTTYQASSHSRVTCAECHVGSGADYLVRSKVTGIPLVFSTLTNSYERPIPTPVQNLRPARDTCEQCHRPERFAGDLVRIRTTFRTDETNTEVTDTRILRVGGGQNGVARDIHWHVAASVWYVSQDDKEQDIKWVGVAGDTGYTREFIDPATVDTLPSEKIASGRQLMDCIDCHNRATHVFRSPEELVDAAMVEGSIDKTLPFIKREITSILYPAQPSVEKANSELERISDFYKNNYPQVFTAKQNNIKKAIDAAKNVARLTIFPHMQVSWQTYNNNAAHQVSPGCFRCHGRLVEKTTTGNGPTINVSCDLCHLEVKQPLK